MADFFGDMADALQSMFSFTIRVKRDITPGTVFDDLDAFVYLAWLKSSGKAYEVKPDLSSDVKVGIRSYSFAEAVAKKIDKAETRLEESTFLVPIGNHCVEMKALIELFRGDDEIGEKVTSRIGTLLTTFEFALDARTGLFGDKPTILEAMVYAMTVIIIHTDNDELAVTIDGNTNLITWSVLYEDYMPSMREFWLRYFEEKGQFAAEQE